MGLYSKNRTIISSRYILCGLSIFFVITILSGCSLESQGPDFEIFPPAGGEGAVVLVVSGYAGTSYFRDFSSKLAALGYYTLLMDGKDLIDPGRMTTGFDPEAAGDMKATLQFEFTGSVEGSCYFIVAEGTIKATEGKSERPDLIIRTPFEVWMDIVTGKADGAEMFMERKYEAAGNMELLIL